MEETPSGEEAQVIFNVLGEVTIQKGGTTTSQNGAITEEEIQGQASQRIITNKVNDHKPRRGLLSTQDSGEEEAHQEAENEDGGRILGGP